MMKYYKLFILLDKKGMKRTDLLKIVSSVTLAKLGKGESVTTDILCKICEFLDCQPSDIMEYVKENEFIWYSKTKRHNIWQAIFESC